MVENIKYKFCKDRNNKEMITIENFPGLDCDLYHDQLSAIIKQLQAIENALNNNNNPVLKM